MIEKPGIYRLTHDEYHDDPSPEPSLSKSTMKFLLFDSPARAAFEHPRLNTNFKKDQSEKFDVGTAAHSILLEGIDNVEVIDADNWRTNAAKSLRDSARESGKTPLLSADYEETKLIVEAAKKAIIKCPELKISSLPDDGDAELSYIWQEEKTWLKVRPDWISKDRKLILDVKFTGVSANPEDLGRQVVNMGYDIQASLYCRGVKAIEGTDPKFVFVFIETEEPYLCSFIGLPPEFMEMGKQKVEMGIFLWNQCIASGKWLGYPNRICWVNPPAWALASWDSKAQKIGI